MVWVVNWVGKETLLEKSIKGNPSEEESLTCPSGLDSPGFLFSISSSQSSSGPAAIESRAFCLLMRPVNHSLSAGTGIIGTIVSKLRFFSLF